MRAARIRRRALPRTGKDGRTNGWDWVASGHGANRFRDTGPRRRVSSRSRKKARLRNPRSTVPRHPRGRSRLQAAKIGRHTSELQSLMRISYAVFCLKKKKKTKKNTVKEQA